MRQITMIEHKEAALLERLDIVQIEAQLEADMARGEQA